jgi:hypothetical protein
VLCRAGDYAEFSERLFLISACHGLRAGMTYSSFPHSMGFFPGLIGRKGGTHDPHYVIESRRPCSGVRATLAAHSGQAGGFVLLRAINSLSGSSFEQSSAKTRSTSCIWVHPN